MNDSELLFRFGRHGDHAAFGEFVHRHADLVYGTALRATRGEVHMARDVTQRVFIAVAQKAAKLARHPALLGWLHRAAWLDAIALRRSEARRRARELAAEGERMGEAENSVRAGEKSVWAELAPVLDEALGELSAKDREAILARHVAGLSFAEVGERLGVAENAARMRTERALEKLRGVLARRGLTSTAVMLGGCLTAHAAVKAPADLAGASTQAGIAAVVGAGAVGAAGSVAAALWAVLVRSAPGLGTTAAVVAVALGAFWAARQGAGLAEKHGGAGRASGERVVAGVVGGVGAPATPTGSARFATTAEYQAWVRRVLEAATPDEAFRLLHEGGVRMSREAFDKAYPRMLETWKASGSWVGFSDAIFGRLFEAWIDEDASGAVRWVLATPSRATQSFWLSLTFGELAKQPGVFSRLLEENAGHPLLPVLKAGSLLAEKRFREAVEHLTGPDFGAVARGPQIASWLLVEALGGWLKAEPGAALAWAERAGRGENRQAVLQALALELRAGDERVLLDTVLRIVEPLKGFEAEGALREYLTLAMQIKPEQGAALSLRVFGADETNQQLRYALRHWGGQNPEAAVKFVHENQLPASMLADAVVWWVAYGDAKQARAWLETLEPEERAAAMPGFLLGLGIVAPKQALAEAGSLAPDQWAEAVGPTLQRLVSTDASAVIEWLDGREEGAERDALVSKVADAVVLAEPDKALDLLARFGVVPDERLAGRLGDVLRRESPEAFRRFAEALPEGSVARAAAMSAWVEPLAVADYAAGRQAAAKVVPPEQVDLVMFNLAERLCVGVGSEAMSHPELIARAMADVELPEVDIQRRLKAGVVSVNALYPSRTVDELLAWAATIKDREIAAGVREVLERVVVNPTEAQRAVMDRLPVATERAGGAWVD